MSTLTTSVILILQPLRRGYDGKVTGIEVDRMVKTKPRLGVRDVAVRLNIEVDENLFINPEPEVTIVLNDRRALVVPRIEADIPNEEQGEDEQEDSDAT